MYKEHANNICDTRKQLCVKHACELLPVCLLQVTNCRPQAFHLKKHMGLSYDLNF